MKVVWAPLAVQRVQDVIDSLRSDRTGVAWRYLQALLARVRGLRNTGLRGYVVREVDRPYIGQVLVAPCRVIYRIDRDRIVILTLRQARRLPGEA